ncbi:MAG TPA: LD-carboxypeptidase, partial [Patescibacteria group bacterium]|nr:LD-carboxypeptidase [Patescibacteria group bacterium]
MRYPSNMVIPRFLQPGGRVTVLAPSGRVDSRRLAEGVRYLRGRGHETTLAPNVLRRHGYLAGDDETRAADFNEAVTSGDSDAIFLARGGYGLTRILDRIDLEALRHRPRLLLGYSDATALFMALQRKGPYLTHYGPTVSEMGDPDAFDEKSLWGALYGEPSAFRIPFRAADVLRPGRGAARVI